MKKKPALTKMMIVANTMIIISLTSCSKKDKEITPINSNTSKKMVLTKMSSTEIKLLRQGYKLVNKIDLTSGLQTSAKVQTENTNNEIARYPLTAEHLKLMGYDLNNAQQRADLQSKLYYDTYIAESIYFNDNLKWNWSGNHFSSGTPNASLVATIPNVEEVENIDDIPNEVFTQMVYNESKEESEIDATYAYKKGTRVSWQKNKTESKTYGFNLECKINIPYLNIGGNVFANITVGSTTITSGDTTSEITLQSTHKAMVPPKSMKRIVVCTYRKQSTLKYYAPFYVDGWIHTKHLVPYTINNWQFSKITFLKTVGYGQYLGGNYRNIFNPKNETGYIYGTMNTTVKVYESEAQPIDSINKTSQINTSFHSN